MMKKPAIRGDRQQLFAQMFSDSPVVRRTAPRFDGGNERTATQHDSNPAHDDEKLDI